jgi:saccharopine dehydrogenase (NAD+, L-lysine-forming)
MSRDRVLLYGASGYSGTMLAERLRGGIDLILAGRDASRLSPLAQRLGLPYRVFGLGAPDQIDAALADTGIVLHAAGPFIGTASPMMDACIRTRTHYLDIAGEWPVFVDAIRRSQAAAEAGIMLMPGAGYAIAATDCLLAMAKARVPDAVTLRLGAPWPARIHRSSALSIMSVAGADTLVRRGGELRRLPAGQLSRTIDFGDGPAEVTAVSGPDVVTGGITTGVANIETYLRTSWLARAGWEAQTRVAAIAGDAGRRLLTEFVARTWPEHLTFGPGLLDGSGRIPGIAPGDQDERLILAAEAVDPWRRTTTLRLSTHNGHLVTAETASAIVTHILNGNWAPGFRTPAGQYGAGFILAQPNAVLLP